MSLSASKGQVIQSSAKKEPEVSNPKKKGIVAGQKNVKAAAKLLQEGPALVEDEVLTFVPVIDENMLQQVLDFNRSVELFWKRVE